MEVSNATSSNRCFFHSFPRLKPDEADAENLKRGLEILRFMKDVGLVMAPELVSWDLTSVLGRSEHVEVLQKRACFTELSPNELPAHARLFGPLSLAFNIHSLRSAGAMPVIYVPQGSNDSTISYFGAFCVYASKHTQFVLDRLNDLKHHSDADFVERKFNKPVDEKYTLNLKNTNSLGEVVSECEVLAKDVRSIISHIEFNNIPFSHSVATLDVFLNMFYPTDNLHSADELGYYRQREWRFVNSNIGIAGHPMSRPLTTQEQSRLQIIDNKFWNKLININGDLKARYELATIYQPIPEWNFFEHIEAIYAPANSVNDVRDIVGDDKAVISTS